MKMTPKMTNEPPPDLYFEPNPRHAHIDFLFSARTQIIKKKIKAASNNKACNIQ